MRLKVAGYLGAGLFIWRAPAMYLGYQERHQDEVGATNQHPQYWRKPLLAYPEDRVPVPKEMYTKLQR